MLEGRVICHDVRDALGKVAVEKGQVLDAGAAAGLLTLSWREIHMLELDPGDIHEEPAGARLSQAAAGGGVGGRGYRGGRWTPAGAPRRAFRGPGGWRGAPPRGGPRGPLPPPPYRRAAPREPAGPAARPVRGRARREGGL